jgi:hypothetical protein
MKGVHPAFILAVSASPRGFAFVVFVDATTPVDWGVKEIRGSQKNPRCLYEVKKLMRQYRPTALVFEETGKGSRRGPRIRAFYRALAELAKREQVRGVRYTGAQVRATFAADGARTRPEIAKVIAARIPAFARYLPLPRKIWMSESRWQSLFDAAAIGSAYYAAIDRKGRSLP